MEPLPLFGVPNPPLMHTHLLSKSRQNPSITTLPAPNTPWNPLSPNFQHKETRPCFPTNSRIHTLTCGHTVSLRDDGPAQPCVGNCASARTMVRARCFTKPVPATWAPTLEKIRLSIDTALKTYKAMLTANGGRMGRNGLPRSSIQKPILRQIFAEQDRRVQPNVDLLGGDFVCTLCGEWGARGTLAAFVLPVAPYWCVAVAKDDNDLAVIRQLVKGVVPVAKVMEAKTAKGLGAFMGEGLRRKNGVEFALALREKKRERVKNARVTKRRVREKKRVLEGLREEAFVDELESLGL
ncbi:hypothetical protein CC80DRAFT_530811 [Byssothecium circinans]|uniref:Uncharacterized protein n=1 Tax=Byssothecium circinans TaxID=147558 RepID=A0A6A5UG45_9PLEO|nr:hypothetical protein CC80DRAFT_530811 [Byssothecium circinans]